MQAIRGSIIAALASATAFSQAPVPNLEFEVASIRPSAEITGVGVIAGVHLDGSQVSCIALSLDAYIETAYNVRLHQILGPDWLASQYFDISAKLPAGSSREQIPEMMQALLADRFGMKFHREMREFAVYALLVEKGGLKMKESPAEPAAIGDGKGAPVNVTAAGTSSSTTVNLGNGSYMTFGNNNFEGRKLTANQMAATLARFVDRPVVDMTELKGNYDFTLQFTPEDFRAMMIRAAIAQGTALPPEVLKLLDASAGDSLFSALEVQGLKLDKRKVPLEVLVIDHMEKSPTDN